MGPQDVIRFTQSLQSGQESAVGVRLQHLLLWSNFFIKRESSDSYLCLWIQWVVEQNLVSHTSSSNSQKCIDLRGNFEMSYYLFSKHLNCLFNIYLKPGIHFLIVLKISRSEQFESNLFHVRERLILSFHSGIFLDRFQRSKLVIEELNIWISYVLCLLNFHQWSEM
jgi:hypothetical protein